MQAPLIGLLADLVLGGHQAPLEKPENLQPLAHGEQRIASANRIFLGDREARLTAAIVGESGLPPADRRALAFTERFEKEFIDQGDTRRTIGETLEIGWTLLETLPREDLHRIPEEAWARRAGRGAAT